MRRPSVLFINRVYPPGRGATGRVLRDLARSFAREGWQVSVVTTGPKAVKERDGGVRVIRVKGAEKPGNVFSYGWIWMKLLFAALRLPGTHLVVSMSDPPFLVNAGQIVKRVKGARHIHWCHDLYPDIFPALGVRLPKFIMEWAKRSVRQSMGKADRVVVIGRCMAKYVSKNCVDAKQITMIPNWPDFELMRMTEKVNSHLMNGHANANGAPIHIDGAKPYDQQHKHGPKFRVLYAGNLGRAHPIETIIGAAEILNAQHPEIEFVFVGDGARFDAVAKERSKRHLDNIRLLPYQPASKLRELMESGDVHLISVKDEAAGMLVPCKLYSALAVQRPCIFVGPKKTEAAKVISDYNAGVVVPQGNAERLAEEIRRYRLSSEDWFAAHHGAVSAAKIFVPKDAIEAWIDRAWGVVEPDMQPGVRRAA